ncbi:MAG: Lrp/AsnC family transcriptional regulator [archaeon]
MWLTKHEKEVLKLLLDDGKLSDTSMADKINISTQAVGRIRKRLEEDVITKYSVELDSKMLGMNIITIIKLKFNNLNSKILEEIEKTMIKDQNVINILKLTSGEGIYVLIAGFKDMEELDKVTKLYRETSKNVYEIQEIIPLPLNHLLKNSKNDLYNYFIESCGVKHAEMGGGNSDGYADHNKT